MQVILDLKDCIIEDTSLQQKFFQVKSDKSVGIEWLWVAQRIADLKQIIWKMEPTAGFAAKLVVINFKINNKALRSFALFGKVVLSLSNKHVNFG